MKAQDISSHSSHQTPSWEPKQLIYSSRCKDSWDIVVFWKNEKIHIDQCRVEWSGWWLALKKTFMMPIFQDLNILQLLVKTPLWGSFSDISLKSLQGQSRWHRHKKMAIYGFCGVPWKKFWILNHQNQNSTSWMPLKSSKTSFREIHYFKFDCLEAWYDFFMAQLRLWWWIMVNTLA